MAEEMTKQAALAAAERMRDWFIVGQTAVDTIRAAIAAGEELEVHEERKLTLLSDIAALETRKTEIQAANNQALEGLSATREKVAAERRQLEESIAPLREEAEGLEARVAKAREDLEELRRKVAV